MPRAFRGAFIAALKALRHPKATATPELLAILKGLATCEGVVLIEASG